MHYSPPEIRAAFSNYALSYGQPVYLPLPEPRDPDVHVLPLPFFELNHAADVWRGKKNRRGDVFRPYVGLLKEGVANSRAELFDGFHLAVFGLEFCVDLYIHFQCLVSHPGVFQGIGHSSLEERRVVWNNGPGNHALKHIGGLRPGETFGPLAKNAERRMLGNRLYHWALRFLGFHELGHLLLGHPSFLLEDLQQPGRINDDAQTYQSVEYTRLRRLLEHQADLHAMQRLGTVALIDSTAPWVSADMLTKIVFELFVAILTVMRIWSRDTPFVRKGNIATYPHPAVRFLSLVEAVRTQFAELRLPQATERAWVDGVGMSLAETSLQDVALSCENPAVAWMDDWSGLREAFEDLKTNFRAMQIVNRLHPHAIDSAYDGSRILDA